MPLTEALVEIRRLSSRYMNEDTPGEERAAEALEAGRPAYWSTSSSTNMLSYWRTIANINGSIGSAGVPAEHVRKFLDRLIPLNARAVGDLGLAYETLAGTFREPEELRRRNHIFADTDALSADERAHVEAMPVLSDQPASEAMWSDRATEAVLGRL